VWDYAKGLGKQSVTFPVVLEGIGVVLGQLI
jgi:hypothetical protein